MVTQNFVDSTCDETTVVLNGETYILGYSAEHGWYVIAGGDIEPFYSGRVAAGTFRLYVETAKLELEAQRRMDDLAMERFRANHPVGSEWQVDEIEYDAAMDRGR